MDWKCWQSEVYFSTLFLGSISIIHERLKDRDNKNQDLKAKIYYLALKTILQRKCSFSKCSQLDANNVLDIALEETYKEGIKIWCVNSFKQSCYLTLMGLIVDYKKQVFVT